MYQFSLLDDAECRANYLQNEANYLQNKDSYAADQAALDNLYGMILDLMTDNSIRLVDNAEFLEWATRETVPHLRDSTRMVILKEDGAQYIGNTDDLQTALDAILTEQLDRGYRSFTLVALPEPFLPVDTCSEQTQ